MSDIDEIALSKAIKVQANLDSTKTEIYGYISVSAVANTYTLNLSSKPSVNFKIETADTTAKTVALSNVPTTDAEIFIRLKYTNAAAITWFANIAWLTGSAPTFVAGKTYRIAFWTENGGTLWHGVSLGGW